jgi:[acyl-carrier-protein] S-malonyltransferase
VLAILAPGQGAQAPGQLRPWLDIGGVSARLRWWSAAAGLDLVDAGTDASAETIRDTAIAQPLLVATGLVAAEQLGVLPTSPSPGLLVAGHSVGEITAAAIAGFLTPEAALVLVALRGRAMADACAGRATGMTALLGGDEEQVVARLSELGLTAANRNGAGQVVVGGTVEQLAALAADPPPRTRLRPLTVAGAFHTHHMDPAHATLAAAAAGVQARRASVGQVSNLDGAVVTDGADLVHRLVEQVATPVRWDLCMARLREAGVTAVVELPPAGVLAGIARRELPGVTILPIKTPADLNAARELLATHAAAGTGPPTSTPTPPSQAAGDADALVGASASAGGSE